MRSGILQRFPFSASSSVPFSYLLAQPINKGLINRELIFFIFFGGGEVGWGFGTEIIILLLFIKPFFIAVMAINTPSWQKRPQWCPGGIH